MENDVELKSKFSNIFIMLLTGIMECDMIGVSHYLSNEIFNKYQDKCKRLKSNKELQCYDELNVGDIHIIDRYDDENYNYIEVDILSKYMDYVIDSETLKYKRGINDHRVSINHHLVFRKRKDSKIRKELVKCPNCGASLDINYSGKCSYCGTVSGVEDFDYILISIDNI